MRRKAGRKRPPRAIKQLRHQSTRRTSVPWITVHALVATAAVGLRPSWASAHESPFIQNDARLAVIDAALRSAPKRLGQPLRDLGYQDQDSASATIHRYDIPAGPLSDVVTGFERVSGVDV